MEAVAAVGLASNILQLVQVTKSVAFIVKDIRKSTSGFSTETARFRSLAQLVRKDLNALQTGKGLHDETRQCVDTLCGQLDQFDIELENLRFSKSNNWFQTAKIVFKILFRTGRLDGHMVNIEKMSNQISIHIVTRYIPGMDTKLDNILVQNEHLNSQLSTDMTELMKMVQNGDHTSRGNVALLQAMQDWFTAQEKLVAQRGCLQALYFPEIQRREDEVKAAHKKTFRWIFGDDQDKKDPMLATTAIPEETSSPTSKERIFLAWLQSQDDRENAFAIFGKPGAGKSTLMKFIAHDPALGKALEQWSGSRELVVAQHFFWNHGPIVQRSLTGLLRSILFQVLKKHRNLIAVAFPDQEWMVGGRDFQFSRGALTQAMIRILDAAADHRIHLFILVDGLDEFNEQDGHDNLAMEETKLIEFLQLFLHKPGVKLCVSSRPYLSFQNSFAQNTDRWLAVHELTRKDVAEYVRATMSADERFVALATDESKYTELVKEIIDKAEGVFLWVYLVCHSLLQGILNGDRLHDLQRRLHLLPRELNDLYQHMLATIPMEYQSISAKSLLIATEKNPRLRDFLITHHYLEDAERAALDKLDPLEALDHKELCKQLMTTRTRIIAHCRGFLDVTQQLNKTSHLTKPAVYLTHRSVGDFLRQDENKRALLLRACIQESPGIRALKACISAIKAIHGSCSNLSALKEEAPSISLEDINTLWSCFLGCVGRFLDIQTIAPNTTNAESLEETEQPLWVDLRDLMCRPVQSFGSAIHLFCGNYINRGAGSFGHTPGTPVSYPGVLIGVIYGSSAICRWELQNLDRPIDGLYNGPIIMLAFIRGLFDCITTMVEYGLSLRQIYEPMETTLWEAVLWETYPFICEDTSKCWCNQKRRSLVISMLRHGAPASLVCSFGFTMVSRIVQDGEKGRELVFRMLGIRKGPDLVNNREVEEDDSVYCYGVDIIPRTLGRARYHGVRAGSSTDSGISLEILETLEFTASDLVRYLFTPRVQWNEREIPGEILSLPPDVADLLLPEDPDRETPAQAIIRLSKHESHIKFCTRCRKSKNKTN